MLRRCFSLLLPVACLGIGAFAPMGRALVADTVKPDAAAIEQTRIDEAMDKMKGRQAERATGPSTRPARTGSGFQHEPYPKELVTYRKLERLRQYDKELSEARQALRRRELHPADVRELVAEQAALQSLSLDRFRTLLMDADHRNAMRLARYRQAFGDLDHAAATVVTILMKAGLIDTAQVLPEDPLSEEVELARGVRRVYYHFILPVRDATVPPRRHNGYVEFQLAPQQGLWLPTWADLEGSPIALFDAEAFLPLQPFQIVYDGNAFVVAQTAPLRPMPLFSLLAPRTMALNLRGGRDVLASKQGNDQRR